jgi:hypothetical protein
MMASWPYSGGETTSEGNPGTANRSGLEDLHRVTLLTGDGRLDGQHTVLSKEIVEVHQTQAIEVVYMGLLAEGNQSES